MKAEDLRYGNTIEVVNSHNGESFNRIWNVTGIHDGGITIVSGHFIPWFEIKPIPLTKKWLLKFGFETHKDYLKLCFDIRMSIQFFNGNSAECDITQDGKVISFKCGFLKYVHQLQNLYFALTGEELCVS